MKQTNVASLIAVDKPMKTRSYMYVNVILTFNTPNKWDDTQEFFEMNLLVRPNEVCAEDFLDQKFFKRVVKKCHQLGREPNDLIKISTAGNWDLFETVTGKQSLPDLGHSCKWFFGSGRKDLDAWEKSLIKRYGFGEAADMNWVNDPETRKACFLPPLSVPELQS